MRLWAKDRSLATGLERRAAPRQRPDLRARAAADFEVTRLRMPPPAAPPV
jgi:hypothetical protein